MLVHGPEKYANIIVRQRTEAIEFYGAVQMCPCRFPVAELNLSRSQVVQRQNFRISGIGACHKPGQMLQPRSSPNRGEESFRTLLRRGIVLGVEQAKAPKQIAPEKPNDPAGDQQYQNEEKQRRARNEET